MVLKDKSSFKAQRWLCQLVGAVRRVALGIEWADVNNGIADLNKGRMEGWLLNACYDPATKLAPYII